MSHYVYGEVQADCDLNTMTRVLESMVPEWKGRIISSKAGDLQLGSNYEKADSTYHIQVPVGSDGIHFEDFGMRRENGKWVVALGSHSSVAGKNQAKFEKELPGEIGRYRAKALIGRFDVFSFEEEENEDEFIFKFKVDGEKLLEELGE